MSKHLATILLLSLLTTNQAASSENEAALPMVPMKEMSSYWEVKKVSRPLFPKSAVNNREDGCAAVAFIIESDGSTSDQTALVAYPGAAFADSALKAIKKWKFSPSENNPSRQPIYTFQVIEFVFDAGPGSNGEAAPEVGDICFEPANKSFKTGASNAGTR